MGENSSGSNDRHAEHGGERDDEEENIRPETLKAVFNHALPKPTPKPNDMSEQTCEMVPPKT